MSCENVYTSIACNRTVEAADWGKNGLILFGANNAVAIFDPKVNIDAGLRLISIITYFYL